MANRPTWWDWIFSSEAAKEDDEDAEGITVKHPNGRKITIPYVAAVKKSVFRKRS
jgi:hypothetical protein